MAISRGEMKKFFEEFLLMALIIFIIVKTLNKAAARFSAPEEEAAPTSKVCPLCKSEIPVDATRCPHCTSVLEEETK